MKAHGRVFIAKVVIDGETVVENFERSFVSDGSPTRIGLVGCSSQKALVRCAARDMYRSPLFRAARAYVEATCQRWYILSARYGLLDPAAVIDPYDQVLTARGAAAWGEAVGGQLEKAVPFPAIENAELVVLAGATYADAATWSNTRTFRFTEPLRGMGIGERIRWLQANTPRRP